MKSISICCTLPKPDYRELGVEDMKIFCRLVYLYRKRGYSVAEAQERAYHQVTMESIPYTR